MTTSIKNNKKVSIIRSAAMMLTVALAIGASAFTNAPHKTNNKRLNPYLFYRIVSAPAHSTANADYVYRPDGDCIDNPGTDCSATFLQASPPTTLNEHPTGSYDAVGTTDAKWDGN